jgi:hypothetical protein
MMEVKGTGSDWVRRMDPEGLGWCEWAVAWGCRRARAMSWVVTFVAYIYSISTREK